MRLGRHWFRQLQLLLTAEALSTIFRSYSHLSDDEFVEQDGSWRRRVFSRSQVPASSQKSSAAPMSPPPQQ
jgi:hypothetical protein